MTKDDAEKMIDDLVLAAQSEALYPYRPHLAAQTTALKERAISKLRLPHPEQTVEIVAAGMHFVAEFDAVWKEPHVKFPSAEAYSYLRGARDRFAKTIGL
ncbi:hypothetical protein CCR97_08025 [Rhodoplanes elegans]|uniref:Uncharacterized protein n=1 Tax=Rhodoplanes elegans TaxID=29408 RepID=A0A327KSS0_9BRAD|nr:hypothetical protein [Rhodoplanes elegans]MBK5958066.1 hypothetical protein [Rhodoplanes elegans]MBK5958158.1 hypothetical protein [Rhodoplanes elegans]RAI40445.1 hypothetical protein CH338_06275 [Rhodoplanes elegans]